MKKYFNNQLVRSLNTPLSYYVIFHASLLFLIVFYLPQAMGLSFESVDQIVPSILRMFVYSGFITIIMGFIAISLAVYSRNVNHIKLYLVSSFLMSLSQPVTYNPCYNKLFQLGLYRSVFWTIHYVPPRDFPSVLEWCKNSLEPTSWCEIDMGLIGSEYYEWAEPFAGPFIAFRKPSDGVIIGLLRGCLTY
jgi:hypothetical protein